MSSSSSRWVTPASLASGEACLNATRALCNRCGRLTDAKGLWYLYVALVRRMGQIALREELARHWVDATGPPIAKARARPHQEHFDLHLEDTGVDPQYPDRADSAPVCGEAVTRLQSPLLGLLSTAGVV